MRQWKGDRLARVGRNLRKICSARSGGDKRLLYIYIQYRQSQVWKKNDRAADIILKLEKDEELVFACQALDFGKAPLIVPTRYRPLLRMQESENEAVIKHDTRIMQVAMEPDLLEATLSDPRGMIYRYCFDKLFSLLDDTGRLLNNGQLLLADLHDLKYWISRIAKYEYPPDGVQGAAIFQPFLAEYEYLGVVELGRKLDVSNWSVFEACIRKAKSAE